MFYRTKQARLFMIQASILHKLGMQRQPSLTKISWSDTQRAKLMEAFMHYGTELGDPYEEASRYTRSLSLLTPSCKSPHKNNPSKNFGHLFKGNATVT